MGMVSLIENTIKAMKDVGNKPSLIKMNYVNYLELKNELGYDEKRKIVKYKGVPIETDNGIPVDQVKVFP